MHTTAGYFFLAAVVAFAAAPDVVAGPSDAPPILCIGDSLTFGEGGNGVSYPGVIAARTGVPTVNRGYSGFIPRHIVYRLLLEERPFLTPAQLVSIPPAEYERRRNQPEIDHLRTFLADGQRVWVKTTKGMIRYRWDAAAANDDATTFKPAAVGDPGHQPLVATGRWRREEVTEGEPGPLPEYGGVVLCVGANGMEADDVRRSLHTLIELYAPQGRFLVLGLINRVDPAKRPDAVAPWASLIAECNRAIQTDYPDHFLDLQAWFARPPTPGKSGYHTREWLPYASAAAVAADRVDQTQGLLPGTLRAPHNTTHLNGTGYTAIGSLAADWIAQHGWLDALPAK